MYSFLRIKEVEELRNDAKAKWNALNAKSEEIEEYETAGNTTDDPPETNINDDNDDGDGDTETTTDAASPSDGQKVMKKRRRQLTDHERAMLVETEKAVRGYDSELAAMRKDVESIWEIESADDYPIDDFPFCGAQGEHSRDESWFRVQNINYWGNIGGFDVMLKRISHAKCAVAVSDLVNLIRPVAQVLCP